MAINAGDITLTITADTHPLVAALTAAEFQIRTYGQRFSRSLSSALNVSKGDLLAVGFNLGMIGKAAERAGEQIISGLGSAVQSFAAFDQQAANASAVSGHLGNAFFEAKGKITDLALELGEKTVFSAGQAADALAGLGQRGVDPAKLKFNDLVGVMDLAAATQSDLGASSELLMTTLSQWGYGIERSSTFADILTKGITQTALKMDGLRESFSFVGPVAASANAAFEDVVAALGVLANAGFDASTAGTGLRQVMGSLLDPSEEAKKTLEGMGLSVQALQKELSKGDGALISIMGKLARAGLDTTTAFQLFDRRGAAVALTLAKLTQDTKKAGGSFLALRNSLTDAGGTAREVAELQMSTLSGAFERLRGAVETFTVRIGQALEPVLRPIVAVMVQIVDAVNAWAEANPALMTGILAAAGALGAFLAVSGVLLTVMGGLSLAMIGVLSALGSPILLAVGAVIVPAFAALAAVIGGIAMAATAMKPEWDALVAGFSASQFTVKETLDNFGLWEGVGRSVRVAWDTLKGAWDGLVAGFQFWDWNASDLDQWDARWVAIGQQLHEAWEGIKFRFNDLISLLGNNFRIFISETEGDGISWQAVWTLIKAQLVTIWDELGLGVFDLQKMFSVAMDEIKKQFPQVGVWVDAFYQWRNAIVEAGRSIRDFFSYWIGPGISALKSIYNFLKPVTDLMSYFVNPGQIAQSAYNAVAGSGVDYSQMAFASGGVSMKTGLSRVNELGREAIVRQGDRVLTASQTKSVGGQMMAGGGISVNISGPVTVRSDKDIEAISKGLFYQIRDDLRRKGIG